MSRVFSQTASPYRGLIQDCEVAIYGQDGLGRISGNSVQLGLWTTRLNDALDEAMTLIFQADGRWQFDDSNHTDYPIITTNIVSGQRDYAFTLDENSNVILDIQRVAILPSASATQYTELYPVDQQSSEEAPDLLGESSATGVPGYYDKTANAIFLDPTPSYNATNGLKIYISREGSYFTTSDTTKKPGIDGRVHKYLSRKAALDYAIENNLSNVGSLAAQVAIFEDRIFDIYGDRAEDEQDTLSVEYNEHR